MRAVKLHLLLLLSFVAGAGCRGISVQSTHDKEADFSKLKTFDWLSVPPELSTAVSDGLLLETLAAELTKKGLRREKEKPDLLVAVQRTIDGTLSTKGSGYEWKDGRLTRYDLQKGMLVVDLVAAANKESVWRSTASGVFRPDMMPDERRKLLTEVMEDMFKGFPPKH